MFPFPIGASASVGDQLTKVWMTMAQVSQHACIALAGYKLCAVRTRALFAQRIAGLAKDSRTSCVGVTTVPIRIVHSSAFDQAHRKVKVDAVR